MGLMEEKRGGGGEMGIKTLICLNWFSLSGNIET